MSDKPWFPLGVRGDAEAEAEWQTLARGVPSYLANSLRSWVHRIVPTDRWDEFLLVSEPFLLSMERRLKMQIGTWLRLEDFVNGVAPDEDAFLRVIDYLLDDAISDSGEVDELASILDEGGSMWTPKPSPRGSWELQERVEPSVEAVYLAATGESDNASTHLALAWSAAFALEPNGASAYREAVLALEAAYQPIVLPTNPKATLSLICKAIEEKPAKFLTRVDREPAEPGSGAKAVAAVLRQIFSSDVRHGSGMEEAPTHVELPAARDAVVLAVSLVQLVRQDGFWLA